jgi:hypothetical protein
MMWSMVDVFLCELNIGYKKLIRVNGATPAARSTGGMWLKLD